MEVEMILKAICELLEEQWISGLTNTKRQPQCYRMLGRNSMVWQLMARRIIPILMVMG